MKTNNKKQNSGGFLSAIAALFKGGAAAGSGVSGAAATGGIFASNAGILGLLLGGATIAAGAGAVYHFAGNATNTASNTPAIFQNSYFEEEAAKAGAERASTQDRYAKVNSSIGMFSEQARKSGLGFEVQEEQQQENSQAEDNSYSDASSYGSSGAPVDYSASAASSASPKGNRLTSKSMGSFSGGGSSSTGSSVPRMKSMGGLSGGVNSKFASMKSAALAESRGSATAMASAKKASISKGRSVSARGRRSSAHSQAMFANAMGSKAAYSSSAAGARTSAQAAFTGETTGTGDVAEGVLEGAGLGGAGLSMGDGLKANNPGNVNNVKNIPQPSNPSNESPWKDLEKALLITLAAATVLLITGSILASAAAKAGNSIAKASLYVATMAVSGAVIAAGLAIIAMGAVLAFKKEYKQTGMGITYMIAGAFLVAKGIKLLSDAVTGYKDAKQENYQNSPEYEAKKKELDDALEKGEKDGKPYKQEDYDKDMDNLNNDKGARDKAWQDSKDAKKELKTQEKSYNEARSAETEKIKNSEEFKDRQTQIDESKDNRATRTASQEDLNKDIDKAVDERMKGTEQQEAYNNAKANYDDRLGSVNKSANTSTTQTQTATLKGTVNSDGTVTVEVPKTPEPPKPTFGEQMTETLTETADKMGMDNITKALSEGAEHALEDGEGGGE